MPIIYLVINEKLGYVVYRTLDYDAAISCAVRLRMRGEDCAVVEEF